MQHLSSFVFNRYISGLDKAYSWLSDVAPMRSNVSVFARLSSDGETLSDLSGACHSGLQYGQAGPIATASNWNSYDGGGYKPSDAALDAFYDWIVDESDFGRFLIAPDKTFVRNVGAVISPEIPARLLMFLCHLLRASGENAASVKRFGVLRERFPAINGNLAFLLAFGVNTDKFTINYHGNPVTISSVDYVRNFVDGNVVSPGLPYAENLAYAGVNGMWSGAPATNFIEQVRNLQKKGEVKKNDAVVIPNPFAKISNGVGGVRLTEKEFYETFVPTLMEYFPNDRQVQSAAA